MQVNYNQKKKKKKKIDVGCLMKLLSASGTVSINCCTLMYLVVTLVTASGLLSVLKILNTTITIKSLMINDFSFVTDTDKDKLHI